MGIILNLLLNTIAIIVTAYFIPGVAVRDFTAALVLAIVLAVLNLLVKPLLLLVTLPINLLTLGLFTFVINAIIILIARNLVNGFYVDGFLTALIFSVVLSLVSSLIRKIVKI